MIATNAQGQSFVGFYRVPEADAGLYAPITHSIIAVRRAQATLMVYAPYSQSWQFPGGLIEVGESPREAALRELLEETNQVASARLLGVMHWDLGSMQVIHQRGEVYGTLFMGEITEERELILQATEVSEWRWLGDDEPLDGLDSLTAPLVQLIREAAQAEAGAE